MGVRLCAISHLAQEDLHRNHPEFLQKRSVFCAKHYPFYAWFLRNGVFVWVCVWKSSTFFPTTNAASDTAHRKFNFFVSDLMFFSCVFGRFRKKNILGPRINGNKPSGVHIFLVGTPKVQRARKIMVRNMVGKKCQATDFFWRIWRSQPSDSSTHITVGPWEGKRHEVKHHQRKAVVPSGWW